VVFGALRVLTWPSLLFQPVVVLDLIDRPPEGFAAVANALLVTQQGVSEIRAILP
jgi:hypothetical protein